MVMVSDYPLCMWVVLWDGLSWVLKWVEAMDSRECMWDIALGNVSVFLKAALRDLESGHRIDM